MVRHYHEVMHMGGAYAKEYAEGLHKRLEEGLDCVSALEQLGLDLESTAEELAQQRKEINANLQDVADDIVVALGVDKNE